MGNVRQMLRIVLPGFQGRVPGRMQIGDRFVDLILQVGKLIFPHLQKRSRGIGIDPFQIPGQFPDPLFCRTPLLPHRQKAGGQDSRRADRADNPCRSSGNGPKILRSISISFQKWGSGRPVPHPVLILFQRNPQRFFRFRILFQNCPAKCIQMCIDCILVQMSPCQDDRQNPRRTGAGRQQHAYIPAAFSVHRLSSIRYPKLRTVFRQDGCPSFSRSRFMVTVSVLSFT